MITGLLWQGLEALGTLLAAGCALYVTFRDGRRIKSGEARALAERVAQAERWHESDQGKGLFQTVDRLGDKVSDHEVRLRHVATREDVARLEGQITAGNAMTATAVHGVERIEGMLMERALGGRGV